jgi:hypothetical protein
VNRNVTGFYHDPPIFVGECPVDEVAEKVYFDRFSEKVLQTTLSRGINMEVTVEGLFIFDFNADISYAIPDDTETHNDFNFIADKIVRRTRIMNAYLAFFYTQLVRVDNWTLNRLVVTPELTIKVSEAGFSFASQRVSDLYSSRVSGTYAPYLPATVDSRIHPRAWEAVSVAVVQCAAVDLSNLISQHGDDGVMLVDLYLRASQAFQEYNHSFSLVNYWTIAEWIINDLWRQMQRDYESREGTVFIDRSRRKRLEDGRTYTAAVMTEFLSFLGYLSKDLYDDICKVRKSRNDWMHDLKPIDANSAALANYVCERLLKDVKGLTLSGTLGLTLHG